MAKYIVTCPAVFVEHESGRVRDRKVTRGGTVDMKAADAKALVDAGKLAPVKKEKVDE